jgi:predicted NBD/HSP70 family sugar kinase
MPGTAGSEVRQASLLDVNAKPPTPGSQSSLRESNRARIVEAIKHYGGLTQVELAGATGLSAATVSNIVKELAVAGVVHTSPSTRSGRRAMHVTLARTLGLVVGVQFALRHMRVALADASGTVITEHRLPLGNDHRADAGLDRAALLVADMLESVNATSAELLSVAIALPAPLDRTRGVVSSPGILRGWDDVAVAEVMERRVGRPVHVENDSNLGALAELRYGAAQGVRQAAYVRVSQRIGAGLIIDGQVYGGALGTAGELGHVTTDEDGPVCRCGNRGCLETRAGAHVLLEQLRGSHGVLTMREMIDAALDGDIGCGRVIADAARHIGVAVASLTNLLSPSMVVVGGDFARAGAMFLDPMRETVERCALPGVAESVEIVPGMLGDDAEIRGAIALAIDRAGIRTDLAGPSTGGTTIDTTTMEVR